MGYCGSNTAGYSFGAENAVAGMGGFTPYDSLSVDNFSGGRKRKSKKSRKSKTKKMKSRKSYKNKKIRSKKYNNTKRKVSKKRRSKMKSKNRSKNGGNLGLGVGVAAATGLAAVGLGAYLYKKNSDKKKQLESLNKLDLKELNNHARSMELDEIKLNKLKEISEDKDELIKFIIDNGYKVPEKSDIE